MKTSHRVAAIVAIVALTGCSQTINSRQLQSHFAFPNGDYSPLGHVSAEKSLTTFLVAADFDKPMFDELTNEALQQKAGNVLVDYVVTTTVTTIPLIPVVNTTFKIDGTALRVVEVGRQQFRAPIPNK